MAFEAKYLTDEQMDDIFKRELRQVEAQELTCWLRRVVDPSCGTDPRFWEQARQKLEWELEETRERREQRAKDADLRKFLAERESDREPASG